MFIFQGDLGFYFVVVNTSEIILKADSFSDCVPYNFLLTFLILCQVCEIIESPLFLKLNPMTKHTDVSSSAFSLKKWKKTPRLCI